MPCVFKPLTSSSLAGLISLASEISRERVRPGLEELAGLGIKYKIAPNAWSRNEDFALPVDLRLSDLNAFLKNPEIWAIWAIRGGYGSIQLLPQIDYDLFRQRAKLFIGFSDITALQWALFAKSGLISLSGLALTLQVNPGNPYLKWAVALLQGRKNSLAAEDFVDENLRVFQEGKAEGILLGGTLSVICSLCGTKYLPSDREKVVLFIEDVNEPLYKIDRYIQQLLLCGFWQNITGLIIGKFTEQEREIDVMPVLKKYIPGHIPVIRNFPYGHITSSIPLPIGAKAFLQTRPFSLRWENFIHAGAKF